MIAIGESTLYGDPSKKLVTFSMVASLFEFSRLRFVNFTFRTVLPDPSAFSFFFPGVPLI